MNGCSIIIPIYNAYDCLKPCIDSVIANTDLKNNKVILINDCSTDESVLPLLKEYSKKDGIILLENTENLGFVKTVNKGIRYAKDDDVLFLNSDTEVTKNWLKKIQECAYSHDRIATVTPLSNNATLASVPDAFEVNSIPSGYHLETFAEFVEKVSLNRYPEIPTGHGFCMFVKRSVIDKVGLLDEVAFGKGYGEENDFCFRCLDIGYFHVLCDNTYILHKESQSFLNNKDKEIKQGLSLLNKRYSYMEKLNYWVFNNAISFVGDNIKLHLGLTNSKPNILFLIHDWTSELSGMGGTTLHAKDIISSLKRKYNFHILYPENGVFKVASYWSSYSQTDEIIWGDVTQFSISDFYNTGYREMLKEIIKAYGISVVHIHHLKGQFFDVFDVCKEQNVKIITTLHDFYFACPLINKIYIDDKYCKDGNEEKCKYCLHSKYKTIERAKKFIASWRDTCHEALKKSDMLITPSAAAKEEICSHYPDLDIDVIEHGINLKISESKHHLSNKNFNIAFIGSIGIHKGRRILEKLISNSKDFNIHLFGITDVNMPKSKRFFNHGKYDRDDLPDLISENNIDLICLFSIWPETYSYTLTEAVSCGVPVISFDFGAIAERIKKYNLGYVLPLDSGVNEIIKSINFIKNDSEKYNSIIESIRHYHIKTTFEMGMEYDKIYSGFSELRPYDVKKLESVYLDKKSFVYHKNFIDLYQESIKWRIVSKIRFPRFVGVLVRKLIVFNQRVFSKQKK